MICKKEKEYDIDWSEVCISIACSQFAESCKICLSLWARQNSIKINNETCESLHTMSHCWYLKKTFKKIT